MIEHMAKMRGGVSRQAVEIFLLNRVPVPVYHRYTKAPYFTAGDSFKVFKLSQGISGLYDHQRRAMAQIQNAFGLAAVQMGMQRQTQFEAYRQAIIQLGTRYGKSALLSEYEFQMMKAGAGRSNIYLIDAPEWPVD